MKKRWPLRGADVCRYVTTYFNPISAGRPALPGLRSPIDPIQCARVYPTAFNHRAVRALMAVGLLEKLSPTCLKLLEIWQFTPCDSSVILHNDASALSGHGKGCALSTNNKKRKGRQTNYATITWLQEPAQVEDENSDQ